MDINKAQCSIKGIYRKNNEYCLDIRSNTNIKMKKEGLSPADLLTQYDNILDSFSRKDSNLIMALASNTTTPIIEIPQPPKYLFFYCFLLVMQLSILISANLLSSKIMHIGGIDIVAGAICFPLTYSLSSMIVEFYGFNMARNALLLSIIGNMIVMSLIQFGIYAPPSELWANQEAFALIFNASSRLFVASCLAIFIGDLLSSYLFAYSKEKFAMVSISIRLLVASCVGLLIDSLLFLVFAHAASLTAASLINLFTNILFHKFLKILI